MWQEILIDNDYMLLFHSYTKHFSQLKHRGDLEFDWDIIIYITDYMLLIGPICQDYFITSIQYGWGNISLIEIKSKLQLFLTIAVVRLK